MNLAGTSLPFGGHIGASCASAGVRANATSGNSANFLIMRVRLLGEGMRRPRTPWHCHAMAEEMPCRRFGTSAIGLSPMEFTFVTNIDEKKTNADLVAINRLRAMAARRGSMLFSTSRKASLRSPTPDVASRRSAAGNWRTRNSRGRSGTWRGVATALRIAALSASASNGSINCPNAPSRSASRPPSRALPTHGKPHASASRNTSPNPSRNAGHHDKRRQGCNARPCRPRGFRRRTRRGRPRRAPPPAARSRARSLPRPTTR